MSAFEKLPREIRDLIYEHCLLYEGEIIPFPRDYERAAIEERVGIDRHLELFILYGSTPSDSDGLDLRRVDRRRPFVGYPRVKRDCWQTKLKPCVALLGVSSTVREEAANILFGKNVWRLSSMSCVQDDRYLLWKTFASYFQHIVVKFDFQDMDETKLLDINKRKTARNQEDSGDAEESDHFVLAKFLKTHQEEANLLKDAFIARWQILRQMKLKSLSLDFSRLHCSHGCCHYVTLQSCFGWLASFGPRYRLEQVEEIKVLGLKDEKEKKLFWEALGEKIH